MNWAVRINLKAREKTSRGYLFLFALTGFLLISLAFFGRGLHMSRKNQISMDVT